MKTLQSESIAIDGAAGGRPTAYCWYVAFVLALFFVLSFTDRQIIGLLVQPIKLDLSLSDVELSLIGGLSFATFYAIFGLALGRLADTYNRKRVIVAGVIVWNTATMLCSIVSGFGQFFILRMGVGLGEAALAPAAYSILADIFPRHRLATALSICTLAGGVGVGFAAFGGAILLQWSIAAAGAQGVVSVPLFGDLTPWRVVLLGAGLPGIVLSALFFTIREPLRRVASGTAAAIPLSHVIGYVRSNWQTFVAHNIGMGCIAIAWYASSFWDIAFFERTYGWPAVQSGYTYGLLAMTAGAVGALTGGSLADYLSKRRNQDSKVLVLLGAAAICIPVKLLYPLMPLREQALGLDSLAITLMAMHYGVAAAALQIMVPSRMRGLLTAVYFVQQVIGLAVGPWLVGALTQYVFQDPHMLRYSLVITAGGAQILAAILFLSGRKSYQLTLRNAQEADRRAIEDHDKALAEAYA